MMNMVDELRSIIRSQLAENQNSVKKEAEFGLSMEDLKNLVVEELNDLEEGWNPFAKSPEKKARKAMRGAEASLQQYASYDSADDKPQDSGDPLDALRQKMKEKGQLEEENAPPCKEYEREIDGKCYPASPTDQGRPVGQTPLEEVYGHSNVDLEVEAPEASAKMNAALESIKDAYNGLQNTKLKGGMTTQFVQKTGEIAQAWADEIAREEHDQWERSRSDRPDLHMNESVNLSTIRQFILEETVGFFKNRIEKPHGRESSSEEFVRKHANETDLEEKKNNSKERNAYVASVMRKIKRKR